MNDDCVVEIGKCTFANSEYSIYEMAEILGMYGRGT